MDMLPRPALHDLLNVRRSDTELRAQLNRVCAILVQRAYRSNIVGREFVAARQVGTLPLIQERSADQATAPTAPLNMGVLRREGMTAFAMGLCGVAVDAPRQVFSVCDRFKVGWVDARAVPAKVVKMQPVRDGANQEFVCEPMRPHIPTLAGYAELTVSVRSGRKPLPALIGTAAIHLRPESFHA